jgi:hypothetical protein
MLRVCVVCAILSSSSSSISTTYSALISSIYHSSSFFLFFKVADTKTVYSVSFKGKDKKLIATDVCDSPNDLSWSYELKKM